MLTKILKVIFKCRFNRCNGYCKCGSSGTPEAPPPPSAGETAEQVAKAKLQFDPQIAQLSTDIARQQVPALTDIATQAREQAFPGGAPVQQQLAQNVLQNLISPTGISPEQQTAIDTRRGEAQDELTQALRTRANLGGGLFGGRAAGTEAREVGNLQNIFAEEDIQRQETARLNAIQSALPILQMFMGQQISSPSFQSAVPGANTAMQTASATRGQDISLQQQQQQSQAALQSALFGALGTAAGGALGTGGIFGQQV